MSRSFRDIQATKVVLDALLFSSHFSANATADKAFQTLQGSRQENRGLYRKVSTTFLVESRTKREEQRHVKGRVCVAWICPRSKVMPSAPQPMGVSPVLGRRASPMVDT